jgi:hypothetical protein
VRSVMSEVGQLQFCFALNPSIQPITLAQIQVVVPIQLRSKINPRRPALMQCIHCTHADIRPQPCFRPSDGIDSTLQHKKLTALILPRAVDAYMSAGATKCMLCGAGSYSSSSGVSSCVITSGFLHTVGIHKCIVFSGGFYMRFAALFTYLQPY